MEEIVQVPVGEGLTLEGTLIWDESAITLGEAAGVLVCAQMLPETRAAVLPRIRRMAPSGAAEWKGALFCFDYRGGDAAAIQADRDAVAAYLRSRLGPEGQVWFWGWPGPRRAQLHWLEIAPAVRLPVYHYPATGPTSRGTVFIASVAPEWAELHDELAVRLVGAGYAVVGVSSLEVPERLWTASLERVTMEAFFAAYERLWAYAQSLTGDDRPLLLVGHSAGSSGNLLLAAHAGRPGAGPEQGGAGPEQGGAGPERGGAHPGLRGRVRGLVGFGNSANKGFSLGFGEIVDPQVWQLEPYLPQVQVPVFLVQGDADFIPPAEIEAQVRLLTGKVHFQVIPGADHDFTDRWDQLFELVLTGLRFVSEA